jgi:predicted metal-dependent hydrolase
MNRCVDDLPFEVIRSRRKTADIIIERDGRLTVRAPETATDEDIDAIVHAKRRWIYTNLAEWRHLNATRVLREYKPGEGFLYLGRSYRLSLVGDQEQPLLLKNGRFHLRRDLVDQGDIEAARAAFRTYYTQRGQTKIPPRVAYWAPKVGVEPSAIEVRELGNHWASCSPKAQLNFHWKTMMTPISIIDYIIVHELCHLHHPNHTTNFWTEVDKTMPNYQRRKEWLREHGAGMDP